MTKFFLQLITSATAFCALGSTTASGAEYCPRFVCVAYPQRLAGSQTAMPRSGYGDSLSEARDQAVKACTFNYGFGTDCQAAGCQKYHGPANPIFSSCVDQWRH